jgi:predicted peptidase
VNDIEGGLIGGLVFVGGIVVLIFLIMRRKKQNQTQAISVQQEQEQKHKEVPQPQTITTLQANTELQHSTPTLHNQTIQRNPITHTITTTIYPETKSQQTQLPNSQITSQEQTMTHTTMKSNFIPMTVFSGLYILHF